MIKKPMAEAKRFLATYHQMFPKIRRWHDTIQQEVCRTRSLTNPMGRKRYFFGRLEDTTFREAVAFIPQSTVADVLNRGLYNLYWAEYPGLDILLQIHDEIVIQFPQERAYEEIWELMQHVFYIPLEIHGKVFTIPLGAVGGKTWNEVSEEHLAEWTSE
jgi:DNA polymerase-1